MNINFIAAFTSIYVLYTEFCALGCIWTWINLGSSCHTIHLNNFLDFAFQHSTSSGTIICPCKKCGFRKWRTRPEVYDHLICKLFPEGYTFWCRHGETVSGEHVLS